MIINTGRNGGDVNAKTQKISKIAEWLLRYGQIRYLGKGRRNPYGVYPPSDEEYDNGQKKTPPALCYVSDRMVGLAVLTSYHAGTYKPGDEIVIEQQMRKVNSNEDKFFESLLSDYNKAMFSIETENAPTFEELFHKYYLDKFGQEYGHKGEKKSMENSMSAAYKNSKKLHDTPFRNIKADQIQEIVDSVAEKRSYSSAELVITLFNQVSNYALANDLIEKNYTQFVRIKIEDDDEHGVPFTEEEIESLWANKDKPFVDTILIYCYSGFRINELAQMPLEDINLKEKTFKGGLKTKYSRERTVPIHSKVYDLVKNRYNKKFKSLIYHDGEKNISESKYRKHFDKALKECGIMEKHTPQDCRHTCNSMLIKAKADRVIRYKIMGHSGKDINEKVYSHLTVEQLREELEKI